jgi:hypothetical protein
MRAPPPHEMVHEGTDPSGMEEWRCPVCGRHFIVRWPPDYERLVLAEGDPKAIHVGTKEGEVGFGGIGIAPAADAAAAAGGLPSADADPGPAAGPAAAPGEEDAWRRWLRDNGIDWDGQVA